MQSISPIEVEATLPSTRVAANARASLLSRVGAALFQPVDIAVLVFFRVVFGAIMLWEIYRYFSTGWIHRYYIAPSFYFGYFGFEWVKPWPGNGMYVHFAVLGVAATCIMLGLLYRFATPIFFLGFTYVFLLDQTRYLNHFYLVCLISFLLIFLPANRAFSVDAALWPSIRSQVAPAWTLWLLRFQVGIAYFYGGIAKLNSDWMIGGEPMRTWLRPLMTMPAIGVIFQKEWVIYSFVYGGVLVDLLVVPLLLWRRTRLIAFCAAVVFNLINAAIFNIGIFPWFMLGATLIFFPPDLMRRFARAFLTPGAALRADTTQKSAIRPSLSSPSILSRNQKILLGLLAAYAAFHVLLPLRHYLYPGNVSWTEEGHNFAWHMKLRTKRGEALFTITHPATGQTWIVDPKDQLDPRQAMKMANKPDMILLFAKHLAEQKRLQGFDNVEVRAQVTSSLNGRKSQVLIDPTVDLAKQSRSLLPANWIVPLHTPLELRDAAPQETDE
ncbi:MAG TPA: HTTM domain-containing protein [Pyrinomonadaceae bacterium]|nr:HTTM domain-containing protein [Pyrinomonadaceae bacterium]